MVCSAKLVDKQLQYFLGQWEGMISKFPLGSSSRRTAFLDQTSMSCNPAIRCLLKRVKNEAIF